MINQGVVNIYQTIFVELSMIGDTFFKNKSQATLSRWRGGDFRKKILPTTLTKHQMI